MSRTAALVVEDDVKTAEVIRRYLESDGFAVDVAHDGAGALAAARAKEFDVVLLDVMLPRVDGMTVCRRLRSESDVAILMVTARSAEMDVLGALEHGADDYVTKPFRGRELVARVRAVLRRTQRREAAGERLISVGSLEIDGRRHEVRLAGEDAGLTRKEFQVLQTLAGNPGRAFSRAELVERAFGTDYEGLERSVDAHVRSIRKKIEDDPESPRWVLTVYGVGYRFVERDRVS